VLLWGTTPTTVETEGHDAGTVAARPLTYALTQNVPNPFNPATTIRYDLPERADVRLVIYNLAGQKIRTLVHRMQPPGRYTVTWDGRDGTGHAVASGVYFYRLEAITRGFVETKRMVLLR
jgi:hypothetical protein